MAADPLAWRGLPVVVTLLAAASGGACDSSPLAGGDRSAEDRTLLALGEAFAADDCATVEELAPGFATTSVLRFDTVTTWYGRCLYRDGRLAEAIDALAPVAHRDPPLKPTPDALYFLGRARYRQGRFEEALADFSRFGERFGFHVRYDNADYFRARTLIRLGRVREAEPGLAAFPGKHPDSPYLDNALYWLVRVRLALGDCDGALAALDDLERLGATGAAPARSQVEATGCTDGGTP